MVIWIESLKVRIKKLNIKESIMEIPIKIKVLTEDNELCDDNCPFLIDGNCTLFNTSLCYASNSPRRKRCWHCSDNINL